MFAATAAATVSAGLCSLYIHPQNNAASQRTAALHRRQVTVISHTKTVCTRILVFKGGRLHLNLLTCV